MITNGTNSCQKMCTFFYEFTITAPSNLWKKEKCLFPVSFLVLNLERIWTPFYISRQSFPCALQFWLNHVIAPISGNMECILQWSPPPSRCTLQPNASAINSQFVNNKCFAICSLGWKPWIIAYLNWRNSCIIFTGACYWFGVGHDALPHSDMH